ncbi:hypothetical protein AK812_SmicGene40336 [Symbiodinium microadriaticum]|uniref:Uncharacterized protein n=1 Tax=Symbiodinium microadriaticum TaxID=2951 RepID=A0A1Q9C933_SYMMI|nr:hypothetical protein AK812_SmicGene40336 [Symbiodinium microadriaticum]
MQKTVGPLHQHLRLNVRSINTFAEALEYQEQTSDSAEWKAGLLDKTWTFFDSGACANCCPEWFTPEYPVLLLNESASLGKARIFLSIKGGFLVQKLGEMRSSIIYELRGCGYLKQDGVTNDSSIKVIQEDFSMRVPNDLSLKDLLEEVGMRGMSNLSRKDLLEDFGARAMRDLNVKVNFGDLRMPQACRGSEVNVVIHLLALRVWLLSRSGKTETFVHAWVYVGGDEELPRPASTMTTTERLLEKVAEGLHQLQQAQLEKLDKRNADEAPEQCKPGTTTLPSLPAPSGNESAVALQDWLEVIDGPLRDISDSSSWWWDAVKKRACDSYRIWVASGPYERLAHKPPTAEDLEKGKFSRLSARTAGMLLQAMAETVRAEMVARSITRSPVALLFRLYTMYQPGGESEKAYILQYLVTPPKAQTAVEMVATLRQWERLLLRADNLSIAKPDPSLLVTGLNALVGDVWAKDRDVAFRTQLVKSRLGISKKNRCYTCGAEGKAKAKSAPGTPSWREEGRTGNPAARSMTTEPEPQPTPPISPTTTGEAASSAGTGEMKEVLRDAAQALKSLMSSGSTATSSSSTLEGLQRQLDELKLKALSVKNEAVELKRARRTPLDVRVEEGVLSDSGATHILRQPRDGAEMASATRVSVTLANDEKRDLLQAESGAILSTSAETQPILPMAELVSAGCEISWKKGNFKVVHPVWGELRTTVRGGCPELAQEQAAKLVNEIEDKKLNELKDGVSLLKAKLEHLVHEEKLPWTTYVERYLEGGLAKDLWKALQGSFMKVLSEHMLDPLCQGIQLGEGWNHVKDLPNVCWTLPDGLFIFLCIGMKNSNSRRRKSMVQMP